MNTSEINNSQIFTESFTKSIAKNSKSNPAFLKELESTPFNIFFKKESDSITGHQNQQQAIKMFTPEKKITLPATGAKSTHYTETYMPGKKSGMVPKSLLLQQYKTYKEDQLLSNPGGDNFFLNKTDGIINNNYDHSKFTNRVGKDLSDAADNILNAVKNAGLGAKFKYVDNNGKIREAQKVGFVKTLSNFFKNVASGLTFGAYTPEGEMKPTGGISRVKHMFKKIFKNAILDNVVMGVPKSMINVGEDIILAGLNSIEVIPDATIGNFKAGRKATTKIFDNTQVFLDYVTDVLPGGDAYGRTHSVKLAKGIKGLPIINNITTPENEGNGPNWKYVRNTRFRKLIETISSFIPFRI